MSSWLRKPTLVWGVALILATNAVALLGVAYNRSGEPESHLILTERELPVASRWIGFDSENCGIDVNLQWRVFGAIPLVGSNTPDAKKYASYDNNPPNWLDETKLMELGFRPSELADAKKKELYRARIRAKEAFMVLELNGKAYETVLQWARERTKKFTERAKRGPKDTDLKSDIDWEQERLEMEERTASRLFVVDVAASAQALRARYPDRSRYAIVQGLVTPVQVMWEHKLEMRGYIGSLNVSTLHVPKSFRKIFEPPAGGRHRGESKKELHFEAQVLFGKRLEPWIATAAPGRT